MLPVENLLFYLPFLQLKYLISAKNVQKWLTKIAVVSMCIYNTKFTSLSPCLTKRVNETTSQFIFVRFSCILKSDFRYCCCIPSWFKLISVNI